MQGFSRFSRETRSHTQAWRFTVKDLIFVGRSDDNTGLIFTDDEGQEFVAQIDDHLVRSANGTAKAATEHQGELGLSVRDIQARIRRGESLASISKESGIAQDRLERFAGPVFAERNFTAAQARDTLVRRPQGDITLNELVTSQLDLRNVDTLDLDWDSWRREDGRWNVAVMWAVGEGSGLATWIFDPLGRSIVSLDDEARWLFQESVSESASAEPETRPRLVALPNENAQTDDSEIAPPAWVGPGQPTIPVPVTSVPNISESPSWDDILFGHRPTDQ